MKERESIYVHDDGARELLGWVRPKREDFASDVEFVRAFHAWRDRVTACANDAFDKAFVAALKRP